MLGGMIKERCSFRGPSWFGALLESIILRIRGFSHVSLMPKQAFEIFSMGALGRGSDKWMPIKRPPWYRDERATVRVPTHHPREDTSRPCISFVGAFHFHVMWETKASTCARRHVRLYTRPRVVRPFLSSALHSGPPPHHPKVFPFRIASAPHHPRGVLYDRLWIRLGRIRPSGWSLRRCVAQPRAHGPLDTACAPMPFPGAM